MNDICFLLRGQKAFSFISGFLSSKKNTENLIVYVDHEINVQTEYHVIIRELCEKNKVECHIYKKNKPNFSTFKAIVAVGWSYLIESDKLFVIHDSILPKYRGFNPLVTALIKGDTEIGATFLKAVNEVDAGPVYAQEILEVEYPMKIQEALDKVSNIYFNFGKKLIDILSDRKIYPIIEQDIRGVSYSVWRDDDDYNINWNSEATFIKRFVDAVGFPYLGASTLLNNTKVRVLESQVYKDLKIENNTPGKIFTIEDGCPVVLCGSGLLKILNLQSLSGENLLPWRKLKSRFR